jgi:hypothetical protein
MTAPVGFWAEGVEGTPDNMNAGMAQVTTFASLPTDTGYQNMLGIATDGPDGNGGNPGVYYRADGSATWTFLGTLSGYTAASFAQARLFGH